MFAAIENTLFVDVSPSLALSWQLVDRFWIGYLPDNEASGRGIRKAGFHMVSDLVLADGHVTGMTLFESSERAQASADFFQLPVVAGTEKDRSWESRSFLS